VYVPALATAVAAPPLSITSRTRFVSLLPGVVWPTSTPSSVPPGDRDRARRLDRHRGESMHRRAGRGNVSREIGDDLPHLSPQLEERFTWPPLLVLAVMLLLASNVFTWAAPTASQFGTPSFCHSSWTVVGLKPVHVMFQRKPMLSVALFHVRNCGRCTSGPVPCVRVCTKPGTRPAMIMSRSARRLARSLVAYAAGVCVPTGLLESKSVCAVVMRFSSG
jgi:hypothetical protein